MKTVFFLCFALVVGHVRAGKGEKSRLIEPGGYVVVSDEYKVDVPAGQCFVTGTVYNHDYVTGENIPVSGAMISTLDAEHRAFTDSTGTYRLVLDSKDTTIYMFAQGFDEIIIWNYKFQSQHLVTINFYPGIDYTMLEADKPVIYLYSDEQIDATLNFSFKGNVVFTYPEYNNGWDITVAKQGIIEKSSGKTYPYLFWEGTTEHLNYEVTNNTLEGFVIATDTVIQFLENSLSKLGLTSTEQTDFITFWAPRMIANPFALVQFFVDEAYEANVSSMTITPQPDAMRRVYMLFTPMQSTHTGIAIVPQHLGSFERSGFTLVEWGGTEVPELILP